MEFPGFCLVGSFFLEMFGNPDFREGGKKFWDFWDLLGGWKVGSGLNNFRSILIGVS